MRCCICKEEKSETEFGWRHKEKGLRHPVCKPCQREKSKRHYYANKQQYLSKNSAYTKQVQNQMRELKTLRGCFDCGEKDFRCLDFDHLDPSTKTGNVATLARSWSYQRLLVEIEKCVVRCANCHRKRTYQLSTES
jgi:L-lysine 2,3-aminomutase